MVLISFASPELARHWQEATPFPFPLFLLLAKGRKLMSVRGNPYQLGGDFLLDAHGEIRLAYPSADPADRPPLSEILAAVPL